MSEVRRLPIYLLLDTSESMAGDPIRSVEAGIIQLVADMMYSPRAIETAYLSVITFGDRARQLAPLTELGQFQPPTLEAGGPRMSGDALQVLDRCLNRELKQPSLNQQGDYRPLIFLMTDGVPADEDLWDVMAERLRGREVGNIIALAAGSQANTAVLKRLTNNVVQLADLQPEKLQEYFSWVSKSIELTSRSVGMAMNGENGKIDGPVEAATDTPSTTNWATIQWDDLSIRLNWPTVSYEGNLWIRPLPPLVVIDCHERSIKLTSRSAEVIQFPPGITIIP